MYSNVPSEIHLYIKVFKQSNTNTHTHTVKIHLLSGLFSSVCLVQPLVLYESDLENSLALFFSEQAKSVP